MHICHCKVIIIILVQFIPSVVMEYFAKFFSPDHVAKALNERDLRYDLYRMLFGITACSMLLSVNNSITFVAGTCQRLKFPEFLRVVVSPALRTDQILDDVDVGVKTKSSFGALKRLHWCTALWFESGSFEHVQGHFQAFI
uniref:Uncharacterized protein n=1 Tax=Moniliophthora roreri TaxID=221103 RepID=A0A0W0FP76_MONRR